MFRARFCAIRPELRDLELPRVLYVHAADTGRALGRSTFALGNDPNLYGHLVKPGLCAYKIRLGFSPVPAHELDPDEGSVISERVLTTRGLIGPVLTFAYDGPPGPGTPLRLHAYTRTGARPAHHGQFGWLVDSWHDLSE